MSEAAGVPRYMAQLLEELGWNQGTRIPLANPDNQNLETILIGRQNEIQRLKEALILQNQKRDDLNKYKHHVHTEYQENTRLLFAHKQQLEQEVKLHQLSCNEADRLDRDIIDCSKQSKDINTRIDRLQNSIARLLKKADSLKTEVCGERGALQEWRAALERNAGDITAIEQFTKQDLSKAKALETKRQKLKLEHDRMHERLNQLVSNLSAEERACERISVQVMEGMEQRKQMMAMWTSAVENLRQRDTDIRHTREDYAVLEAEANNLAEQSREQQAFFDQQRGNNLETEREIMAMTQQLSRTRMAYQQLLDQNATLDSDVMCLQRELTNMRNTLEKLHMENRQIMEEQHRKDQVLNKINSKIRELKEKLTDSLDKSKSSEKRAKELQDMLNEEERYASQLTVNQQRAMHCSFVEQQKLLALKNEEKLFHMQLKASKAGMSKLDTKQRSIEKNLQSQKESLYSICYQVETIGSRVAHMEGAQAERMCSAELVERENRLKDVCARHAARVALLERHSAKLHDDMRRLARDLEAKNAENIKLQSRLKTAMLNVEGGDKDVQASRDIWRRLRVEEALLRLRVAHAARAVAGLDDTAFTLDKQRLQLDALLVEEALLRLRVAHAARAVAGLDDTAFTLDKQRLQLDAVSIPLYVGPWRQLRVEEALLRLRVAHAARAVAGLDDTAFTLDKQRLQLDAAMNERLVEIAARRDMFSVQKRALFEDCGKLRCEIREREQRIEQLKKRYEIFIGSLGKDESGQQLSVTFFKIKFAAERAELRTRGAALDADIGRRERDVSALEATLRVVAAAHQHFMYQTSPLAAETPEIEELNGLTKQYYEMRDELKRQNNRIAELEQIIGDMGSRFTTLSDKNKQLAARRAEAESDLDAAQDRVAKQEGRLQTAHEVVAYNSRRAKKLIEGTDDWRIFQMAIWNRDYAEAASSAIHALSELCAAADHRIRLAALLSSTDLQRHVPRHQRRLLAFIQRIIADAKQASTYITDSAENIFSTSSESVHSGVSIASGYTKHLAAFRRTLAPKVQESALTEDIPAQARRSTVSLRVVTLGIEESARMVRPSTYASSRKSLR